jgi:CubicO group peptidase (beta-lactamase class C family)
MAPSPPGHLHPHPAGFRGGDQVTSAAAGDAYWDAIVAGICAVEREEGWEPGERAGYHLACGMTMLAEVVRRVDGRRFEQYVREEVFLPLGMDDCWVGMPPDRHAEYGARIGTMHNTQGEAPVPLEQMDTAEFMARCIPGGGGRGPMRQLARLYRALLGGGELDGARILSAPTVAAISARHRVGLFDETFHCECDWGLGFAVDNFAMGRHASRRAFGHGGALSSYAFTDPDHDLVVAVQTNGMCASDAHYQRLADVMTAVYLDLQIVPDDAKGRDKAMPQVQL